MNLRKYKKVEFKDKRSTYIDKSVKIGHNVIIYENNRLEGDCIIGDNVIIYPNCYLKDTIVMDNSTITSTHSENAIVGKNCSIGPFARLRPNAKIMDGAKVGNFVEIKNATIGKGTKVSHLAYVGDADIGEECNIGCGVIFVNYNGKQKNRTKIGDNCFIGSNSNLIAPLGIEKNSYVCAGTTVTENVDADDFVIGRVRQVVKPNRAHKYLKSIKE